MAKLAFHMSPLLTDELIEVLSQRKIFTFLDVLETVPEELRNISGLSFKDVLTLRSDIISRCCPLPQSGNEVQNDCLQNSALIPSGLAEFDEILNGGFPTGSIVELCGESAVGKTHLCMVIALNAVQEFKQQVHWIDAKSDFCARGVFQMLELKHCDDEEVGTVMESIKVVSVTNYFELYSALQNFQDNFSNLHANIRLVVIDSIPAIFFNFTPNQRVDGICLSHCLVSKMKQIAQEFHLTFILVNVTYRKLNEELAIDQESSDTSGAIKVRVALGKFWSGIPNTRLLMEKVSLDRRKITVLKSTNLPNGVSCIINPFKK